MVTSQQDLNRPVGCNHPGLPLAGNLLRSSHWLGARKDLDHHWPGAFIHQGHRIAAGSMEQ